MASLADLMTAVRAVRDALHGRFDDNVTERVHVSLRLRHTQAAIQARREATDPNLKATSVRYDPIIVDLDAATATVTTAIETDEPAMLMGCAAAGKALDKVEHLP